MDSDDYELINSEEYFFFIPISQTPIWIMYVYNLIWGTGKSESFNEQDNINYYFPARIFNPCDDCLDIRIQLWRLISYSLVHLSFKHIFANSLCLLIYSYLNFYQSSKYLTFVYVNSIIIGSLAFLYFNPYGVLIGNSAGVHGLMGSGLGHQLLNFSSFPSDINIILGLLNIIPLIVVFTYYFLKPDQRVSHVCHFYGYLAGLASGLMVFKKPRNHDYHLILDFIGFSGFITLNCLFIYGYKSLPNLDNPEFEDQCCF